MNNGQRVQLQFLEQLPFILVAVIFAGFNFPWLTAGLQIAYIIFRKLYTISYTTLSCGPKWRWPWHLTLDLIQLVLLVLAIWSLVLSWRSTGLTYPKM